MSTEMCNAKLEERFQSLFEKKLIDEICLSGYIRKYEADVVLVDMGMLITHMPLVLSGYIKIMTTDDSGDELLLYYLESSETCAVTLNCCSRKSKSTVRAITESACEILFIPVDRMEEWMVRYKTWRNYVLDSYNQRLGEMVRAIDDIVFNSLEERIKGYLKDKALIAKDSVINISHQEIADDLYSSRVAISRLMKKLESQNYIEQHRNKVLLLDYNK